MVLSSAPKLAEDDEVLVLVNVWYDHIFVSKINYLIMKSETGVCINCKVARICVLGLSYLIVERYIFKVAISKLQGSKFSSMESLCSVWL